MRGDVTDAGQTNNQPTNQTLKIELLSQWKLEAESRNSTAQKSSYVQMVRYEKYSTMKCVVRKVHQGARKGGSLTNSLQPSIEY